MASKDLVTLVMGAILTVDTGILLYMLKGYIDFRNNLHKELSKEFVLKQVCEAQREGILKDIIRLEREND